MSGEKEVRLRESEYHRLMNAARRVENEQSQAQRLRHQLQQARQQIQARQAESDRRQRSFEHSIGQLSQELQRSTRAFQQRLTEQRADFEQQVARLDHNLQAQRQEYLGLIAEQAAQVQQQFDAIAQQRQSAKQQAEQWLADGRVLLDYIEQHQRHQEFAPGELDVLKSDWTQSQRNIQAGHEQAAIATSQVLYGKALKLQAEIEYRQIEWDTYYSEALTSARAQLAAIEAQETARWVFDTEQGSQELDAEIDYWSDGALGAFKQNAEQAVTRLEQDTANLTLDDLKQHIQANQDSQAELERLVAGAKERLIASQLRVNIAQDLLDELAASGWQIEDSTWEGETTDGKGWKNSYHVKLKDLGGNEMITVILPENSHQGSIENRVQFAYFPKDNNDARFAADQTARLNQTLADMGLTREPLQCVPGHERTIRGSDNRRDFATIRARAPSRIHKPE